MTEISINFSGITHDHGVLESKENEIENTCSTIVILRRHPMYDCLVLAKKYRSCLKNYSLEFPLTTNNEDKSEEGVGNGNGNGESISCGRRKLISKFVDGDDPMYQSEELTLDSQNREQTRDVNKSNLAQPFTAQIRDNREDCELIHVPVNGLLDRLKSYTNSGISVDSRVYAFAIGLKTAERILTNISLKEPQETPI